MAIGNELERQLSKKEKTLSKLPEKRAAAVESKDAAMLSQIEAYLTECTAERDKLKSQVRRTYLFKGPMLDFSY